MLESKTLIRDSTAKSAFGVQKPAWKTALIGKEFKISEMGSERKFVLSARRPSILQ